MSSTLTFINDLYISIKNKKFLIIGISLALSILVSLFTNTINEQFSTFSKIFPLSFNKSSSSPVDDIKAQFGISDKTDYSVIYNIKVLVNSKTLSYNIAKAPTQNIKFKTLGEWLIYDHNKNINFLQKKINVNNNDSTNLFLNGAELVKSSTKITVENTEFTEIKTITNDKALSKELNIAILNEISNYYVEIATEKPRTDLFKIQTIRDSLRIELSAIESAIAGFQDANQLSVKYSTGIPQAKLLRTRAEIEQLYSTTAIASQNAQFKLLSESPIFQILDYPGVPYETIKPSWKKFGIISFIAFSFLLSLFFCRKVFMKMILEELNKSN